MKHCYLYWLSDHTSISFFPPLGHPLMSTVHQAAIVCYEQKIALTCALLGVLGLESIKQEDKEFAGWVHFTDQPEDVAYISPHIVFSFPNLAKHNQISQVSLKMLHTTRLCCL